MANRPWQPSEDDRKRIRLYSCLGLTQEQIAAVFGKSVETIVKYCRDELDAGKAETIAKVAGTLVNKALKGDTASAIFYLKTQAGWRETSNVNLQTDREVVINMSRRSDGNG